MFEYIIKFSWEIWTKSKNVRFEFVQKLSNNIKKACSDSLEKIKVEYEMIRIYTNSPVEEKLKYISWISYFSEICSFDFENIDEIADKAYEFYLEAVRWKKFAVKVKRTWTHSFTSVEVATKVRDKLKMHAKVDLDNPEITCNIEVKQNKLYLLKEKTEWLGWLPMWVWGKVLLLFSGWIDSAVASYMLYRSWLDLDFLYFDLWWTEPLECALIQAKYLKEKYWAGSKARFTIIDWTDVISEILKWRRSFYNLMLKYSFYNISSIVAAGIWTDALATGESVNQVSTQTLANLWALDSQVDNIILRPVITMPKQDIIKIAYNIWTFELSYKWVEFCALATKWVETRATKEELQKAVWEVDLHSTFEKVLKEKKVLKLEEIADVKAFVKEFYKWSQYSCNVDLTEEYINIDLRDESEIRQFPVANATHIPYETAFIEYKSWDKNEKYNLICTEWRLSKILAKKMIEDGFQVVYKEKGLLEE